MKKEFRAHPIMIVNLMKPFLFVLIFPLIKGVIQYFTKGKITGVLTLELIAFAAITLLAALRCYSFRLICGERTVTIKMGIILRSKSVINVSKLSSVQTVQNPADAVFRAVTYRINTEAGPKGSADFEFKLSIKDSREVSRRLFGDKNPTAVKFSVFKVAVMAATTSSAVTGMIIGVPIINKAGKLLGLALDKMLYDEINNVSEKVETYFPPIVNTITLIFLLAYGVSFFYSLFKYINFKLYLEKDKLEVRSGFFVRSRTSFKKESVKDVIIDQTPLMRLFKRYAMKVSVGGYGNSKSESAVIVPSGRRGEIKRQFSIYFPFLEPDGKLLHANRDNRTKSRFLYFPKLYFIITLVVSTVLSLIFKSFNRLFFFLTIVACCIILYYAYLCIFEFRFGKLKMGKNVYAQTVKGFNTCELYCPRENVGQIKLIRNIPDIPRKTCKVVVSVCSESADSIKVRHLNYEEVKKSIAECYGVEV
ncbi:MAG: PH domain-containing protein [Acutalibacteraceae bacterium]